MVEYNFLNLSAFEFENLSRDLLQEKLGKYFESFTSGQDGGIDLRATLDTDKNIIVQAKRYSRYSNLKLNLKKEVKNVHKLSPGRYILTTSVGLSPANKEEIKNLFKPYIKSTEDILGKDDLNNLLGLFSKIEEQYYKLWLSSTNVLQRLVNSAVYNQSKFEFEEIKEVLKVYVQNDSFNEAFKILKDNNYVIISGIPGIGKTTLSRMLVYWMIAKESGEFVYVSESVKEAYDYYNDGKKQVFFFDDFLGRNFLETGLAVNEDSKLIKFIEQIKRSDNKMLILATREYILRQARNTFELLDDERLDLVKCTLDLSKYTRKIKAQILYNHLFFANVPNSHIRNLVDTKSYLKLIEHKSYNPRIIETFVKNQFWENVEPKEFSRTLVSFFDNPISVWQHAFENTISKEAQIVLIVLSTMGTPVLLEDLKSAFDSFIKKNNETYNVSSDSMSFGKTIKELENTFIRTGMDSLNKIAIEFQNPSVQDFLINYIEQNKALMRDLIGSFVFTGQFFTIFTFEKKHSVFNRRITLDNGILELFIDKLISDFDTLMTSSLMRLRFHVASKFEWYKSAKYNLSFLDQIFKESDMVSHPRLEKFVVDKFEEEKEPRFDSPLERSAYLNLLSKVKSPTLQKKSKSIVEQFAENTTTLDALKDFSRLSTIFQEPYNEYVGTQDFADKLFETVEKEIQSTEISQYEALIDDLREMEQRFEYSFDNEIKELTNKNEHYIARREDKMDFTEFMNDAQEHEDMIEREDQYISDLFEGLADE